MVTLAAMQLGKATVVPDVEGVAQYVVDGASGIVYQLGDEDAVAAALDDVRGDPERLDALGRAAQGALCRVVHARAF